jgi:predicted RNase H-related nuclease YkuK (DUF458 family)
MDKYFRTQQGERVNVIEHTLDQLKKWPNLKMYVGSDSQDYGKITRSVTVVVYRYGHRGAHFVYHRTEDLRARDIRARLMKEAQDTLEAAQIIDSEIPISFESLDFDFNTAPKWASNKVLSEVKGWMKGMNYKATFKGEHVIATKAADHVCRHPSLYP